MQVALWLGPFPAVSALGSRPNDATISVVLSGTSAPLHHHRGIVEALLEVKPYNREANRRKIEWQEACQIWWAAT